MENDIKFDDTITRAWEAVSVPKGDYEETRNQLLNLIETVSPIIEPNIKLISFNNFIEHYLFFSRFDNSKFSLIDYSINRAYYLIGLSYFNERNYEDAIINLKKAIELNPFDALSYLQLIDTYKKENDEKKMYITLFQLYKFIYNPEDFSKFLIELGDYFYNTSNNKFANILYSYSTYFEQSGYVEKVLTKIALEEKRAFYVNTKDECVDYLNKYKFPTNILDINIGLINELYNKSLTHPEDYELRSELKRILFVFTENEIFEDRITIKNQQLGFTFKIPEKWKELDRTQFNKSSTGAYTLYVIEIARSIVVNLDIIKNVNQPSLIDEYKMFRDFIHKQGYNIVLENEISANKITYIQSVAQKKILNDYITMIHCIFIIKNYVLDLTLPTLNSYNEDNIKEIYKDINAVRLNKIINSIEFI